MSRRALASMQEMRRYLAKRLSRADLGRWDAEIAALSESMTWHVEGPPRPKTDVIGLHVHWGPVVVYWDGELYVLTHNEHPIAREDISAWAPLPDWLSSLVNSVKQS